MLNMQSANAGSIGGMGGGMPAPALNMGDGGKSTADIMGSGTKTNSETITVVNTNHEGMIVSKEFFKGLFYFFV